MLSDADLFQTMDRQEQLTLDSYQKVYQTCINLIKSESKKRQTSCTFLVPPMVLSSGYRTINTVECGYYIVDHLMQANVHIVAQMIDRNTIVIEWGRRTVPE